MCSLQAALLGVDILMNPERIPPLTKDYYWNKQDCPIPYTQVREAPFSLSPPPCGHCPNSIYTPSPALKRALWGTFFRPDLSDFVKSPF